MISISLNLAGILIAFFQSTYCTTILQHCENVQRSVQVVNLDPAAEHFDYPVLAGMCIDTILLLLSFSFFFFGQS